LRHPERTFHIALENRAANKLDYFVHPTLRQRVRVQKDGSAIVFTTVSIKNGAPLNDPPSYQLGPDPFTRRPGDYLGWLLFWGPSGADLAGSVEESGLRLYQQTVPV